MMVMLSRLFRWRLSLMNGVSAVAGYLLMPRPPLWPEVALLFAAISLLAAAASALNQLLERDLDLLMSRTSNRPLPQGALSPTAVATIGIVCLTAALLLLLDLGAVTATVVAGGTVAWYLCVYTPLKRRSRLSLLLGALCGAATPLIGWSVAGGELLEFPPLLLALLLYLWQVPHFLLLQRRHQEEFQRAGLLLFDLPGPHFPTTLLLVLWSTAVMAAATMLPLFGLLRVPPLIFSLPFSLLFPILLLKRPERLLCNYLSMLPLLITVLLWYRIISACNLD
jgi:heme o synthase